MGTNFFFHLSQGISPTVYQFLFPKSFHFLMHRYLLVSRTTGYVLPIPTYFFEPGKSKLLLAKLVDKEHDREVAEIAPNLIYLGAGGIKTIGNLYITS